MLKIFKATALFLLFGAGLINSQSLGINAAPFVIFDGMFVSGNLSSFSWGQSTFDVEWLTGFTPNTNSLKWVQGDEWGNGWTGAGFNITSPVDLSLAWVEDSLKFKMKAQPGTGLLRAQFESGADGKVGYLFQPIDDDQWHDYALPLSQFVPQDGTTNFDSSAVIVFQIMAEASAVAGTVIYLDKVWTGNATENTTMPLVMVDGDVSDGLYQTLASWDGADNWGSSNDLGSLKFFTDGNQLYIGLSGKIEENWNKIAIFIDFDGYNGVPAGNPLPGGGVPGFFQDGGIGGSTLNMDLDYAFSWTTDGFNPLWCDAAHYDATSVVDANGIGNSNKTGNPSTLLSDNITSILGGTTAFGLQAYRNTFDRSTNPNDGLEVCFDITAFQGVSNLQEVRFFVAIVNNDGSYWSNEILPDYYNTTGGGSGPFGPDLGTDPDINTLAISSGVNLFTTPTPLPVELTSFTAGTADNNVFLNWETSTELNNSGFQVERSLDGTSFEKIAFVPGYGTTTENHYYSYKDSKVSKGTYYYRLKQIDYDGSYSFSEVINVTVLSPLTFSLQQNYPNPFNPSTKIAFTVPQTEQVELTVFNLLGEKIVTLVDGITEAGVHEVTFDATKYNSGIYFYELRAGEKVSTKKMILMK